MLDLYLERVAILSFHVYLLALRAVFGFRPQEVDGRLVTNHLNVKMVLSGYYHSAKPTASRCR